MVNTLFFMKKMFKKNPFRVFLIFLQIIISTSTLILALNFVFEIKSNLTLPNKGLVYQMRYVSNQPLNSQKIKQFSQIKEKGHITKSILYSITYSTIMEYNNEFYKCGNILYTEAGLEQILDLKIITGSFFSQSDIENETNVVVISERLKKDLFGEENPINKSIGIEVLRNKIEKFRIIGVYSLENQGNKMSKIHVMIPIKYDIIGGLQLFVLFEDEKIEEGKNEILDFIGLLLGESLSQSYRDENLIFDDIYKEDYDMREHLFEIFGIIVTSFAFLSLIVSGTGILSIMSITIVERTKEIGLRRTLGASKNNIIRQIVMETMIVSIIGGIGGIIVVYFISDSILNNLIANNIKNLTHLSFSFQPDVGFISLLGVGIVGLIASLYPAYQASLINPVKAIIEGNK